MQTVNAFCHNGRRKYPIWRDSVKQTIEQLKKMGFNEYESKAYLSLVKQGPVSAYQVSKDSGIPRSRIYDVLGNLSEKGIVMVEEIEAQIRYSPLPVAIFLEKARSDWESTYVVLEDSLKQLETETSRDDNRIVTLKEKQSIVSYCASLIQKATKRIVLSVWDDMYELLKAELEAVSKDVSIQGITLHVEEPTGNLEPHRITTFTEAPSTERWFILSIDSNEMIYGPSVNDRDLAFYTDDPIHIHLLEDYVWHDVLVNRLAKRNQDELDAWITKERKAFFIH